MRTRDGGIGLEAGGSIAIGWLTPGLAAVGVVLIGLAYVRGVHVQQDAPISGMGTIVLKQGPGGGAFSVGEVRDASDSAPDVEMLPLEFGWPADGSRVFVVGMNGGRMPARAGSGLEWLRLRWRYDIDVHARVDEVLPGDAASEGARTWTQRRVHATGEWQPLARREVPADSDEFFAITEAAAAVLAPSPSWSGFEGFDGSKSLVRTRDTSYGQVVFSLSRSDRSVPVLFCIGVALVAGSIGGLFLRRRRGNVLSVALPVS
ncbi:MAG: hypothetical protein AAGA55_05635 [Planctomycetota bacterium]